MSRIEDLVDAMTLDEQVSLLSGEDFWSLPAIERLGIPKLRVTDGPNGARGGGSLVFVGTFVGHTVGFPGMAAYASSKAAVRNHTKSVALYCAEQGLPVRCNAILPGWIATEAATDEDRRDLLARMAAEGRDDADDPAEHPLQQRPRASPQTKTRASFRLLTESHSPHAPTVLWCQATTPLILAMSVD